MPRQREPSKIDLIMDACNHVLDIAEALEAKATLSEVRQLRNELEDAANRFADRVKARKRGQRRKAAG